MARIFAFLAMTATALAGTYSEEVSFSLIQPVSRVSPEDDLGLCIMEMNYFYDIDGDILNFSQITTEVECSPATRYHTIEVAQPAIFPNPIVVETKLVTEIFEVTDWELTIDGDMLDHQIRQDAGDYFFVLLNRPRIRSQISNDGIGIKRTFMVGSTVETHNSYSNIFISHSSSIPHVRFDVELDGTLSSDNLFRYFNYQLSEMKIENVPVPMAWLQGQVAVTPEPNSLLLFLIGLGMFAINRRKSLL